MLKNSKVNNITFFLNSLSYWQAINLYITLLQSKEDISFAEDKKEAILNYSEPKKLHYLLEEALNSPNPKTCSTYQTQRE